MVADSSGADGAGCEGGDAGGGAAVRSAARSVTTAAPAKSSDPNAMSQIEGVEDILLALGFLVMTASLVRHSA